MFEIIMFMGEIYYKLFNFFSLSHCCEVSFVNDVSKNFQAEVELQVCKKNLGSQFEQYVIFLLSF